MKIILMGTGSSESIPALFCDCEICKNALKTGGRNIATRQQALIDDKILIDFGPDTFAHLLACGLNLSSIENIFITHSHEDHFLLHEIPLRNSAFAYGTKNRILTFYCNDTVKNLIEKKYSEQWFDEYFKIVKIANFQKIQFEYYTVIPFHAAHAELEGESAHIFYLSDGKSGILYCTDSGIIKNSEMYEYMKEQNIKLDLVVFDCTKGDIDCDYPFHMSMSENNYMKERLIKERICNRKTTFFCTHFSHNCKMDFNSLNLACKKYGMLAAYDGLTIEI